MVTATFAGMILNWTAPLFLIAWRALVSRRHIPTTGYPMGGVLARVERRDGRLPARLRLRDALRAASGGGCWVRPRPLTLLLAVALAAHAAYAYMHAIGFTFPLAERPASWRRSSRRFRRSSVSSRFLRSPSVRTHVLKAVLILAGFVVPIGAIALASGSTIMGRPTRYGDLLRRARMGSARRPRGGVRLRRALPAGHQSDRARIGFTAICWPGRSSTTTRRRNRSGAARRDQSRRLARPII